MEPSTQAVPGYYAWEVPGQAVRIQLNLDVVDRMGVDIMRGFGALPKRGAEVGGLLLGSIETGDVTIIRIKDYEAIPCLYKLGPSYLFGEDVYEAFDPARERWQPGESRPIYAVGYYRSQTRDGPLMTKDDIELMDRCFPLSSNLVLLVRPFVARTSEASLFIRQDGRFPDIAVLGFPFRRDELAPEPAVEEPSFERFERKPSPPLSEPREEPTSSPNVAPARRPRLPGWVWVPLSFVFLTLGLLLGYQAARTTAPAADPAADFSLALSVTRTGNNLTVRWNRAAPAVRAAQKGLLEIEDGAYSKPVELDLAHLQGGSLIYRNSSNHVRFRLIVSLNARSNVAETLEWRQ
jgi:hypothetical protein